jgi:hypothetical protein
MIDLNIESIYDHSMNSSKIKKELSIFSGDHFHEKSVICCSTAVNSGIYEDDDWDKTIVRPRDLQAKNYYRTNYSST